MRIENCSYVSAIRKIGEHLGIDTSQYLHKKQNELHSLYQLNYQIASAYHKYLFNKQPESQQALDYLTNNRKLSLSTIKQYQIGFSPEEDILQTILNVEKEKNRFSESLISESNIFAITKSGTKKPYFKNRIIFPISNAEKEIIGFSGRGEEPKYLNIKNNKAFSKKHAIFNVENLKENKRIYIFEGFIDLLKAQQELYCVNGIACMGGIVSPEIYPVLKKYTNQIALCFDNDSAGHNFTLGIGKDLLINGFEVSVVDLLDIQEKDIDEVIDKSPDKSVLKAKIDNPICFIDWIYKKNKPQSLDSIVLLEEECLSILFNNSKLKSKINASYAKEIITKIFEWYKNTPEYTARNLEETLNNKKEKYITIIDQSSVASIPWSEKTEIYPKGIDKHDIEVSYSQISSPFIKLTIKFQNLPKFLEENPDLKKNKKEWEYQINQEYLLDIPEIKWLISRISFSRQKLEIPENISKYKQLSRPIKCEEDFFNNYYNFYYEYLDTLINFNLNNSYEDIENRLLKNLQLKKEQKQLKEVSRKFFLNSTFSQKN